MLRERKRKKDTRSGNNIDVAVDPPSDEGEPGPPPSPISQACTHQDEPIEGLYVYFFN